MTRIAFIVGSLRQGSLSRKTAEALIRLIPEGMTGEIVEIGDLPLYNPDLDGDATPQAWTAFRDTMREVDGVVFVTPEYNRSVPASVKNVIDVGSRPYGQSVWAGKPAAIVSLSPGAIGGFGANHHLRQSLVFLDMPTLQQPEAYIGGAGDLFDEAGEVKSDKTQAFLASIMSAFGALMARYPKR
ncbi:MAG TPA: NADPH-dependent FMN reductase [Brevundimonas sp.]|jgi:chromate reductase|uniref:NADPH-dependent FMN reductase n=1 Tax=Brevundimonas sp. TaxID=1871086 RepID=UPI002C74296F|nr:NADPH-dependent FMN reductase [Brevundimonas sp.]HRH20774.1 NADPH-dependent FMN reductase [Brevundimonas sp.]